MCEGEVIVWESLNLSPLKGEMSAVADRGVAMWMVIHCGKDSRGDPSTACGGPPPLSGEASPKEAPL